jgi:hypothetical protein
MRKLIAIALIIVALPALAQETALLHECDTLDGVAIDSGSGWEHSGVEVVDGAFRVYGTSPAGHDGNSYLSVVVPIPPTDFRGKALVFDASTSTPAESQGLYVRAVNAAGDRVMSWASWNGQLRADTQTFSLHPRLPSGGLSWEADGLQSDDLSAVTRLVFFVGTHNAGVEFDMTLDNIRAEVSDKKSFLDVTEPKPLYPDTTLVEDGEARAVIVAPGEAEWAPFTAEVAAAIEAATGVALPIITSDDASEERLAATNAIVIGSIANNRALLYPYSHQLTFADGVYPGDGGYELRTVPDPWGTGKNMIAIGASDLAGAQAALEVLRPHLTEGETLIVPSLLEVELTGAALANFGSIFTQTLDDAWAEQLKQSCEDHLVRAGTRGLFSMAEGPGQNYALSGRPEYAQMYVWMIKRTYESYLSNPTTYGGPWGMDSDFHIYRNIPYWDSVEECSAVSGDDRLEVTKILFRWVSELGPGKSASPTSTKVRFNHQTFPALGCLYAGQYFSRYYDAVEGDAWIEVADGTFQFQLDASKPHCDCNSYQWLTLNHVMIYSMARPDLRYFENGNAARNADYAIMTMSNLGYQVAYGDIGGWGPLGNELRILRMAEWFYRDGRFQWAIDRKEQLQPRPALSSFSLPDRETSEPTDLLGTTGWAVDPMFYDSFAGSEWVPLENAVDKVSFRDSFDPEAAYLLLDGLSVGGHGHMDGNAILQWTDNGRIWLADADYIKSLPKYHNSMLVLRDGQSGSIPSYVELENLADLETFGASQTVSRNYAGVDWHRNVIWIKPGLFVVADRMVANEPGDYSFRAVWQTIGETTLDGARLSVEQAGQHATIAMTPDTHCILNEDEYTGKNWASYPHIEEPLVKSMQGIIDAELDAGEQVVLFTVMHASGEEPADLQVRRLTGESIAITGLDEPVIVSVQGDNEQAAIPGAVSTNAQIMALTPARLYAIGASWVNAGGELYDLGNEGDIEADLTTGEARIYSPAVNTIGTRQYATTEAFDRQAGAQIGGAMSAIIDAAGPVEGPPAMAGDLPTMTQLWAYIEQPDNFLLTGNPGEMASVPAVREVRGAPEPLEANVFSGQAGTNLLSNIFDGRDESTTDSTMWAPDQEVTIDLELLDSYHLDRMSLSAWFATSSSKGALFQLGRIRLLADDETLVDLADDEARPNWGAPGHAPEVYEFDLDADAQNLRLILTPRPGTAVYLADLKIWGTGEGLDRLAAAQAAGREAVYAFNSVHSADIDGDGVREVLGGSSNGKVYCLDASGALRWSYDCGAEVNSVTTVDLAGNGRPAIVAGANEGYVVALNADGQELWTYQVPYYKRVPHVQVVFPADFSGEGRETIIAGADSWRFYAIDAQGNALWHYESVHGSTAGAAADVNADGIDEVVAGTEYYTWHVINPDGSRLFSTRTAGGPCANAAAAGDLDGDGRQEVIFGGADTTVQVYAPDGSRMWVVNTGDEVTDLACADVDGDGQDEILVSSLSFNVYCLEGDGSVKWRTALPNQLRTLTLLEGEPMRLAVGCDDGSAYALSAADGSLLGRFQTEGRLIDLAPLGAGEIAASSEDGFLYGVRMP